LAQYGGRHVTLEPPRHRLRWHCKRPSSHAVENSDEFPPPAVGPSPPFFSKKQTFSLDVSAGILGVETRFDTCATSSNVQCGEAPDYFLMIGAAAIFLGISIIAGIVYTYADLRYAQADSFLGIQDFPADL
jgi:hypothetical protein